MYEVFFGLSLKPFELVPNPSFLYQSRSHRKARNYLKYGLRERAGFILLTGEVGSGKTTIIRDFMSDLDENIVVAMVFNTKVSTKQVLAMINEDFGLSVSGRDKVALLRELNDFLVELHAQNKYPILIIDEAQNLSSAGLEEIRLLSNLEAADSKLLQIIMVGQNELKESIAKHELRQLRQRISVHCHLDPLTREETEEYVFHRLEVAGNRNAVKWGEGCFDVLYRHSKGVPRLINTFCDFILLDAYVAGMRNVDSESVEEIINDTSWDKPVTARGEPNGEGKGILRQGMLSRLNDNDRRLAQLEEFSKLNNDYAQCLQSVENLLREILTNQGDGFRKIEKELDRTAKHLAQFTVVGEKVAANSDSDSLGSKLRASLLGKRFFNP
jgi:putative secretion ATPase (PEP-CTERM system associated)